MGRVLAFCVAVVVTFLLVTPTAFAQEEAPLVHERSVDFQRVVEPGKEVAYPFRIHIDGKASNPKHSIPAPIIDGRVKDPCWAKAYTFMLGSDMPNSTTSRPTRVRVCSDDKNLYIAFECRASELSRYPRSRPYEETLTSEAVMVSIRPRMDSDETFMFAISPNSATYDWRLSKGKSWSGTWRSKSRRRANAWDAEIAIPFADLGIDEPGANGPLGCNFRRRVAASGERCSWVPTLNTPANADLWGHLFFGSRVKYRGLKVAPQVRLYPERFVFDSALSVLRATLRVRSGSAGLADAKVRITRLIEGADEEEGDLPASRRWVSPLVEERCILDLNVLDLPVGETQLAVEVLDAADGVIAKDLIRLTKSNAVPVTPGGKLTVLVPAHPVQGATVKRWPITTGVALPKGALRTIGAARLLAPGGKETPLQTSARAFWPDGSIKWLGLDFCADITPIAKGKPGVRSYTLEYGPKVKRMAYTGFVRQRPNRPFDSKMGVWSVNSARGKVLFSINSTRFTGVEQAWVDVDGNERYDWVEQIIYGSRSAVGPELVDSDGNVYAFPADKRVRVRLEEWNELRLVFRGEGPLVLRQAARGNRDAPKEIGRCVMRITAYADQWFVRVESTFILSREGATKVISSFGVRNQLDFRDKYHVSFGTEKGYRKAVRDTGNTYLMWLDPDRYVLRGSRGKDALRLLGAKAAHWAAADIGNRGVAICIRDMRHLFPKSFELGVKGQFITHFWPPHKDGLRVPLVNVDGETSGGLGFVHTGEKLNLRVPSVYSTGLRNPGSTENAAIARSMKRSDATGMALTHDMLYIFFRGKINPKDITETSKAFDLSPHAIQDRDSLARSGVIPEMLSPARAKTAIAMAKALLKRENRSLEEGEFNFGNMHRNWLEEEKRWSMAERWVGTAADVPGALWTLYLQTGDPDIYRLARRNLRHILAIQTCHAGDRTQMVHADPQRRKIPGGFADMQTPVHWQGVSNINNRHVRLKSLALAWNLAGDRNARAMIMLWAKSARGSSGVPIGGLDGAVFIDNLWAVLQMEHDAQLLERLGRCADYVARQPWEIEPTSTWNGGLRAYAAMRGDERVMEPLRALAKNPKALERARDEFALIGLLRDQYAATNNPAVKAEIERGLEEYELNLMPLLKGEGGDDELLRWKNFAAYVFGAGDPVPPSVVKPAAPKAQ
jgi:PcRGLX-like N-terminal RIFT barrel domain